MKKILIIFLVYVCSNTNLFGQKLYESAWVDMQNEMTLLTVEKENGKYWLKFHKGKFEILNKAKPSVSINGENTEINIDEKSGTLSFNNVKFIPEFKSRKRRFSGKWKSTTNPTIFDIKLINGGITWDIKKNESKPIRFYPKLTEEGFTFTIGEQQLFFKLENGYLIDNNGNSYIKIART